jgi:hypothetical protein
MVGGVIVIAPSPVQGAIIEGRERVFLLAIRQALIIALGALEDYLMIVPEKRAVRLKCDR